MTPPDLDALEAVAKEWAEALGVIQVLLCFIGIHKWRTYEEAVALGVNECCTHCTGWHWASFKMTGGEEVK